MSQPTQVLMITNEPALRNLCEQFFIVCGAKTITATTVKAAKAVVAQLGLKTFRLVVLDTAVFGDEERCQQRVAGELIQVWTDEQPGLPILFTGTVLQKHTLLARHTDMVFFLVKPLRLNELADAVQALWPGRECPPELFVVGGDSTRP